MTEKEIVNWMHENVKDNGFTDAASLAKEFLHSYDITNSLDPDFSKALDAGFKVAQEVYQL